MNVSDLQSIFVPTIPDGKWVTFTGRLSFETGFGQTGLELTVLSSPKCRNYRHVPLRPTLFKDFKRLTIAILHKL